MVFIRARCRGYAAQKGWKRRIKQANHSDKRNVHMQGGNSDLPVAILLVEQAFGSQTMVSGDLLRAT